MRLFLISLIIISLTLRVVVMWEVNPDLHFNPDEERNYQIALNHHKGLGYSIFDTYRGEYRLSSFHSSFPVFFYSFLIEHNISQQAYTAFCYFIFIILFVFSVLSFNQICKIIFKNDGYSLLCTATYALYPSVIIYIGSLAFYENFVMPLLIININKFISAYDKGFRNKDYLIIPLSITISALFRPQVIAVYALLALIFATHNFIRRRYHLIPVLLISFIMMAIAHIPVLLKNKSMFGEFVLSTQSGFELLQGHNPLARGSWMGNWEDSSNVLYQYAHSKIAGIYKMSELEESKKRKEIAYDWIIANPLDEMKLIVRKFAIYFLPQNYEILRTSRVYNPVNLVIHLLFAAFIIVMITRKDFCRENALLLIPVAATMILSLIYFVGYRWRFYAEPFMIICAWRFIVVLQESLTIERHRLKPYLLNK